MTFHGPWACYQFTMILPLLKSPVGARALPFLVFVLLTAMQGLLGSGSQYWIYVVKTFLGAWMILSVRKAIPELRWSFSPVAILTGIGVFGLWVGLEGLYPHLSQLFSKAPIAAPTQAWNPHAYFGQGSLLAWSVIVVRCVGVTLVVPPIEEAFYRSLLYRAIERSDFLSMPLSQFAAKGFFVTSLVFGLSHREWLPGILCGMAYQFLVLRRGHLGEAMAAHAVTNALLAGYVLWKGAWQFW